MYIYRSGAIGSAIHAKIENSKQSVRGETSERASFRELLKSQMYKTQEEKPVSASYSSAKNSAGGSALLYAMQNSGTDSTASAVLETLGFGDASIGDSMLKTAAQSLLQSADLLGTVGASEEASAAVLDDFISDYNSLYSLLSATGSYSSRLYSNALKAYTADKDSLFAAGISVDESGKLSASGEKVDIAALSSFIDGTASVARSVSDYSSSISGSEDTVSSLYSVLLSEFL